MPWIIKKKMCGDIEFLPDLVDTPIWKKYSLDYCSNPTKRNIQIAGLYKAIADRENYFQENTPTAFGNPEYNLHMGIVRGYVQALDLEESVENNQIVISKNGKPILIVDKIKRPQSYYETQRENRQLLRDFGL